MQWATLVWIQPAADRFRAIEILAGWMYFDLERFEGSWQRWWADMAFVSYYLA